MKERTSLIIAFLIAALWIYAAIYKLTDHDNFVKELKDSPILTGYQNAFSWIVPAIELTLAFSLFSDRTRMKGLKLSFLLLLGFTCYIWFLVFYFNVHTCSCGGILSHLTWQAHIVFNLIFVAFASTAILLNSKKLTEKYL